MSHLHHRISPIFSIPSTTTNSRFEYLNVSKFVEWCTDSVDNLEPIPAGICGMIEKEYASGKSQMVVDNCFTIKFRNQGGKILRFNVNGSPPVELVRDPSAPAPSVYYGLQLMKEKKEQLKPREKAKPMRAPQFLRNVGGMFTKREPRRAFRNRCSRSRREQRAYREEPYAERQQYGSFPEVDFSVSRRLQRGKTMHTSNLGINQKHKKTRSPSR